MAFATQNVKKQSGGSLNWLAGEWTSAAGDTSGTVTVGGSRVYFAEFTNQDTDSGEVRFLPYSVAISGATIVITVSPSSSAVTTGRFLIAYL